MIQATQTKLAAISTEEWAAKTIRQIATEVKCAYATALRYAVVNEIAYLTAQRGRKKKSAEEYYAEYITKYDWNKSDSELQRRHKLSRELFRQIRKKLGLPSSKKEGSRVLRVCKELPESDWELSNEEIAKKVGCSRGYISKMRNILSKQSGYQQRHDWSKVDFNGTAAAAVEILGCSKVSFYCQKARRKGAAKKP